MSRRKSERDIYAGSGAVSSYEPTGGPQTFFVSKPHGGGASGNPTLTALWRVDPVKAANTVRNAMNGHSVAEAAKILGIGLRTLRRWIADGRVDRYIF